MICNAQVKEENEEYVVFDLTAYEPMRNRAITAVHNKELQKAKSILDSCYAVNNLDTMVISLLHETLLMKINTQREPNKNLTDIKNWETQYPFLKEDKRLQEIKVKDAVSLGMQSFDSKNINSAESLTKLIIKTIQESKTPTSLKKIPNVDALIYNVGMQLFYDKQFKAAYHLFSSGTSFFPQDKNMNTMYKLSKERIQTKK